jgi:hypothetical protein
MPQKRCWGFTTLASGSAPTHEPAGPEGFDEVLTNYKPGASLTRGQCHLRPFRSCREFHSAGQGRRRETGMRSYGTTIARRG